MRLIMSCTALMQCVVPVVRVAGWLDSLLERSMYPTQGCDAFMSRGLCVYVYVRYMCKYYRYGFN